MKTLLIATFLGMTLARAWSSPTDERPVAKAADRVQAPKFDVEWRFDVNWQNIKGTTPIDENEAANYIGKVVWISVAYQNEDGEIVGWKHRCGTITKYSQKDGIQVDLFDSEQTAFLPSAANVIRPNTGGKFRLSESRTIEDPDYLAIWYCSLPKLTQ